MKTSTPPKDNKRLLSLDVLRGITIAGMILVNNPGDWGNIYTPLRHAEWNGLTPTDLVFPFFMFIMGISTYISLRKTKFEFNTSILGKILKRTAIIFFIGIALSWIGLSYHTYHQLAEQELSLFSRIVGAISNFDNLRILGVMQRLALTYGATALIAITMKHKYIPKLIAILLVGYLFLLFFGNGFEQGEHNILAIVDQSVLGLNHMYVQFGLDPEGLLSTIPSIAHVLIGFCFGRILLEKKDNTERMLQLFIWGAVFTFAGFLLHYLCPINKIIWSPSFVLSTCGLAATLLSLLIWIIDVEGYKKWSVFFESFGANPLFIFVFGSFMSSTLGGILIHSVSLKGWIYKGILSLGLDLYLSSFLFAVLFITMCWAVGQILYRKKIYIKI